MKTFGIAALFVIALSGCVRADFDDFVDARVVGSMVLNWHDDDRMVCVLRYRINGGEEIWQENVNSSEKEFATCRDLDAGERISVATFNDEPTDINWGLLDAVPDPV